MPYNVNPTLPPNCGHEFRRRKQPLFFRLRGRNISHLASSLAIHSVNLLGWG